MYSEDAMNLSTKPIQNTKQSWKSNNYIGSKSENFNIAILTAFAKLDKESIFL
jgi:hypothetical protein